MSHYVDPDREQFEAFKALPRDLPVMMLNLLRFREKAAYDDGRDVTGEQAVLDSRLLRTSEIPPGDSFAT